MWLGLASRVVGMVESEEDRDRCVALVGAHCVIGTFIVMSKLGDSLLWWRWHWCGARSREKRCEQWIRLIDEDGCLK